MKCTIPQSALAAAIDAGGATVAKKAPIAILTTLRLTVTDDTLAVASSDMDRFSEATVGATGAAPGAACVDAVAFSTLIGKYPKGASVTIELDGDALRISCNRSRVRLGTLSAATFPAWADAEPDARFTIAAKDFARAVGRVKFAAADLSDAGRWHLQGVRFDYHDGNLHFVAFDGNRIAVSGMSAPAGSDACPAVTVPIEAIEAALKVFKDAAVIDFAVSQKAIGFVADGLKLSSRLIDSDKFPDYANGIPARGNPALTFKRGDFAEALGRAACLVGDGEFSSIIARPDGGTIRIEARNQAGGEAIEELAASIDDGFQPFGFNPRYGAQFIAALNVDEITIEQSDPNAPHLIYSNDAPDFVGMVGPVRIAA